MRRLLAALLSFVLLAQPLLADASQAHVWGDRKKAPDVPLLASLPRGPLPALSATARVPIGAARHEAAAPWTRLAPPQSGRLTRVVAPAAARALPPIFFIQDVHGSAEAQKNIRDAVAVLLADKAGPILALEGAFGPVDLTRYRTFPEPDVIPAAADFLFAELELSGPARAALAAASGEVMGIDDAALHRENVEAYLSASRGKDAAAGTLEKISADVDAAKGGTFPDDLRALDQTVTDFRAGNVPLSAYAAALAPSGADADVRSFLEAARLESTIDFARAESERARMLEKLVARATQGELALLVENATLLRLGRMPPAEFYLAFDRLCCNHDLRLADMPAFASYVRYVTLSESIDGDRLWRSLAALEKAAFARLARTPEQAALVERSRAAAMAGRLIAFSLSAPEWVEWKTLKARYPADLSAFEKFYIAAEKRDAAMAENVLRLPARPIVLVAGGFHAEGLAQRLSSAGRPVVVWTPAMKNLDADLTAKALGLFAREKTPLEELFQGRKLFLAGNPFRGMTQMPPLVAALSATPEKAVSSLWPGVSVKVRRSSGVSHVSLSAAGRTVRTAVRHMGLSVKAVVQMPAGAAARLGALYDRVLLAGGATARLQAAGLAALGGFAEEFLSRVLIGLSAVAVAGVAGALGFSMAPLYLAMALVLPFALAFATVLHPRVRLGGVAGTVPAGPGTRALLATTAVTLGIAQVLLLSFGGSVTLLSVIWVAAVLGAAHALLDVVLFALGVPLAMSLQLQNDLDRATVLEERDVRLRELIALSDAELMERGLNFQEDARIGEMTPNKIGRGVALFTEAARRAAADTTIDESVRPYIGGAPSVRQIEAMLAMLKNRNVVGMRPSEGKTLSIALTAFIMSSSGRKVEVHDWNNLLTIRDGQVAAAIMSRIGVKVGIRLNERSRNESAAFFWDPKPNPRRRGAHLKDANGEAKTQANLRQSVRRLYAESAVVYGPYDRMFFDWMEDWYSDGQTDPLHPSAEPDVVLTEESDSPLIDTLPEPFVAASAGRALTGQREMFFRTIYGFAQSLHPHQDYEVAAGTVRFVSPEKLSKRVAELRSLLSDRKAKAADTDRLEDLLLAALEANYIFRRDVDYFVINRNVVIRDPNNGEAKPNHRWARGLHTFVEIKEAIAHRARREDKWLGEESSINAMMISSFFYRVIPFWSGVAGVLDDATQATLRDVHGATATVFEPVFASRLTAGERLYFRTIDQKHSAIVRMAVAIHNAGRPVLINARDPLEARLILSRLESALPRGDPGLRLVIGRDEDTERSAWNRMGSGNQITVAAQVASRGHEIKVDDSVYAMVDVPGYGPVGGLTVISTYRAIERLEAQVRTRAGRRGMPGQYQLMEHLEGNETLERAARDELALLLAEEDAETRTSEIEALFSTALERVEIAASLAAARANAQQRTIIVLHLQFIELARIAAGRGEDLGRLVALAQNLVHMANAASQTQDNAAFDRAVNEFRREIRFLAGLVHRTGMDFADALPLAERLVMLRNARGYSLRELAKESGIPEHTLSQAEAGNTERPLATLRSLENFYVNEQSMNRIDVRRALGRVPAAALLPRLQGLSVAAVLKALRENEWTTDADIAATLLPAIDGRSYNGWENGVIPTMEQRRQVALHFAEDFGYDYNELRRVLGIPTPQVVLRVLNGLPRGEVMRGLRGDMTEVDLAGVIGVGPAMIHSWEMGKNTPEPGHFRALLNHHARQGYSLQALKTTMGIPNGPDLVPLFADKTPFQVLEIVRGSGPYEVNEWAPMLGVSAALYHGWGAGRSTLHEWQLRAMEGVVVKQQVSLEAFRGATGVRSPEQVVDALRGKPLIEILTGLREMLTGKTWKELADELHVPLGRYQNWEKKAKPTRPNREDRERILSYYALRYKMPRAGLRELLDVQTPAELLASVQGQPYQQVIARIQLAFAVTAEELIAGTHTWANRMRPVLRGERNDELLRLVANYLHEHRGFPLDPLRAALGITADETPLPGAGTSGTPTGVWPIWSYFHSWAVQADKVNRGTWRLPAVVAVIGFLEEFIARPLLALLPFVAPFVGLDPTTLFATGLFLYAVAFATVLHPRVHVGTSLVPRRPTLAQRLRLFSLAAGLGVLQIAVPLPAWALIPLLAAFHAVFNLHAVMRDSVLGMAAGLSSLADAESVIRSETADRPSLLAAIAYIGDHPGTADLELLNLALEENSGDVEVGLAVIEAMRTIRRTSAPFYRKLQNEDLNGIIWHALRDTGVSREHFVLVEDPDGRFKELRFRFPSGERFEKVQQVMRGMEQLYHQKNPHLSPRLEVLLDTTVPEGQAGLIRIYLPITQASLTDHQRGFGMLEFSISPDGELLPLLAEELAAKLEEYAWTFLRGMDPSDPRHAAVVRTLYGDGTPEQPGVLSSLRQLPTHGDRETLQVESTSRPEPTGTVPRSAARTSLNKIIRMANYLPYFTRFIPEKGIDHIGYFARSTGSHFSASYMKGLVRGHVENDFMIYVSRDTIGLAVYRPLSLMLAAMYGMIGKGTRGDDGRVKDFTIYRLAATQWLRNIFYVTGTVGLPDGRTGFIIYRKNEAWHDETGRLHEKIPVFDRPANGKKIAEIHRITKSFDFRESPGGVFHEEEMVDKNPEFAGANWVEDGFPREFSPGELEAVARNVPPFQNRNRIIYAIKSIGAQMENSPFLQKLPASIPGRPRVVELIDEVGIGSGATLTAFAIEENTHVDEERITLDPELARLRSREPETLSVADGERWKAIELAHRDLRRTARSVEVELFIGKARDFGEGDPLPGFPALKLQEIMDLFKMTQKEAETMKESTTGGSEGIPQPYSVDWENLRGQPVMGDVPIRLESPVVRSLAYLKELMIYNGVVRYYRGAYVRQVVGPLLSMIGNPETPEPLHRKGLEALPEFSFSDAIRATVRLAAFRDDLIPELDAVAQVMFERNMNQALSFDDGKIQSVERFEALQEKLPMIEELASDSNPLPGLRQKAIAAMDRLAEAAAEVTVLGMEMSDYSALTDAQRAALRRRGFYPFPLMSFGTANELAELERERAIFGVGPARLATHGELLDILRQNSEPEEPAAAEAVTVSKFQDATILPLIEEAARLVFAWTFGASLGGLVLFPVFHAALHFRADVLSFGLSGTLLRMPLRIGLSAIFGAAFYLAPMAIGVDPISLTAFLAGLIVHVINNTVALRYRDQLPAWLKPFSLAMSLRRQPAEESREVRVAQGIIDAMTAIRDGNVDRRRLAASLKAALNGAEVPINVGENPFDALTRSRAMDEIDERILGLEIARRMPMSETEASNLLLRTFTVASGAAQAVPNTPAGERPTGTLWVMDASNAGQAADVVAKSAGKPGDRLLILVTDPALLAAAEAAARAYPDRIEVRLDENRILAGEAGTRSLKLYLLESEARDAWGADFMRGSNLRVLTPAVAIDLDGLHTNSDLRAATFIILDALTALPVTFGTLESIASLARIIGQQA